MSYERNPLSLLTSAGGDGAEVIYALRNNSTLSKKILNELEKEGQNVRKYYQQRLPSNPIKDYYFMQRDTPDNETVTVEYGFIDSPKDDVEQIKNTIREQVYSGAIILCHDIYEPTALAIVELIPELIDEGYQLVTIDEYMAIRNISMENGEIYP